MYENISANVFTKSYLGLLGHSNEDACQPSDRSPSWPNMHSSILTETDTLNLSVTIYGPCTPQGYTFSPDSFKPLSLTHIFRISAPESFQSCLFTHVPRSMTSSLLGDESGEAGDDFKSHNVQLDVFSLNNTMVDTERVSWKCWLTVQLKDRTFCLLTAC